MSKVIFLLGAGASMDAGLPSVGELTTELKSLLPNVRDVNKETHPEFPKLFDAISKYDPDAGKDYERFLEWLTLLMKVQRDPFRHAFRVEIEADIANAAGPLALVINRPIVEILRSRLRRSSYRPCYLAKLGDFLPKNGRLKVFTLNYDLAVEDACRDQRIAVTTGFKNEVWCPSVFREKRPGINLYKLHGSLNWFIGDKGIEERSSERDDHLSELLLGPGSKLQYDDPFVSLYWEFHKALRGAKVCVVIGYSFRDNHIKNPLLEANHLGLTIIDVRPSNEQLGILRYNKISKSAKEAFERGDIERAVEAVIG